jgi:hypothetical protein
MLSYKEILMQHMHYQSLLQEAEKERLVRQTLRAIQRPNRLVDRALNWLGRQLVCWGQSLQKRYGTPVTSAHTSNHTKLAS